VGQAIVVCGLPLFVLIPLLPASGAEQISIPAQDGVMVSALTYGAGQRGVVLAHGGQYKKESWDRQAQTLAASGFRVVAFDFRGSEQGRRFDVLAAVHYLRQTGAKTVSVVGASMGGDYAAEAAEAEPDAIDRLVLLASGAYTPLVHAKARKLFILSRDDFMGDDRKPRLPGIRAQFEKASGPKNLVLLDGSAHAQAIFATDQGDRLMLEILRFLSSR
jgi:pimeloyl-ACP methyl ester carboxylesterase